MPSWTKISKLDDLGYGLNSYGSSVWGDIWSIVTKPNSVWNKVTKIADSWNKLPKV